jgi:hypothetical protein
LVANLSHRYVEDTDWDHSEFSLYDLGQAVAHMTVQAQAMGMFVSSSRPVVLADETAEEVATAKLDRRRLSGLRVR